MPILPGRLDYCPGSQKTWGWLTVAKKVAAIVVWCTDEALSVNEFCLDEARQYRIRTPFAFGDGRWNSTEEKHQK
jgi:hypothetical protein